VTEIPFQLVPVGTTWDFGLAVFQICEKQNPQLKATVIYEFVEEHKNKIKTR
jgi:hypothetical protein